MSKHPSNVTEIAEHIRAKTTADVSFVPVLTPSQQQRNAFQVWKNGEMLYGKVVYEGPGMAVTDANPNGHHVTIYQPNQSTGHKVSVSDFLNSLDHSFIKVRPKRDW